MHALVYHGPGEKAWEEAAPPTIPSDTRVISTLRSLMPTRSRDAVRPSPGEHEGSDM